MDPPYLPDFAPWDIWCCKRQSDPKYEYTF